MPILVRTSNHSWILMNQLFLQLQPPRKRSFCDGSCMASCRCCHGRCSLGSSFVQILVASASPKGTQQGAGRVESFRCLVILVYSPFVDQILFRAWMVIFKVRLLRCLCHVIPAQAALLQGSSRLIRSLRRF
jgi:hypothetical protein